MSNTNLLGAYGGLGNAGLAFRNKIINGGMDVWQRGISFTTAGGLPDGKGVYNSADRWKFLSAIMGTGYYNVIVNRSTDAPTGFAYSASVGNNYGTTDHLGVMQPIEGINCVELAESGVCTISVYLKKGANAPAGKNITISLVQCKTTDVHGNFIDDVAVNYDVLGTQVTALDSLASWTRVTFTVTGLTANVARGLGVCFYVSATDISPGADIFKFTGASLEAGPVATPFEHRPIGLELQLCQRYAYAMYANSVYASFGFGFSTTANRAVFMVNFPCTMRAVPTLGTGSAASAFALSDGVTSTVCNNIVLSANEISNYGGSIAFFVASGLTVYRPYRVEANNNANAYLVFSAEL